MLEAELSVINQSLDTSKKRNHLYHKFVAAEQGFLGHCVCIRIPDCIIAFIRSLIPSPDNCYTGHRGVDEDGVEDDANSESFENVSLDSNSLGMIDYAHGEAIKLTISFDNNKFDLAHICNFISKLPMRGWNITFFVAMNTLRQIYSVILRRCFILHLYLFAVWQRVTNTPA